MMEASSTGYLARLFKLLTAHFNLDELRTLCFDLSVDYGCAERPSPKPSN